MTATSRTLEFRPSESYGSILDLYYTDASQLDNARSLEVNLGGYPAPCCDGSFPAGTLFQYSNPTIKDNTVVAGNLNTVVPLVRNFKFTTDDTIFAGGWLNEFQLNDQWQLRADLSYSKATRDQKQFETNAQYEQNSQPCGTTWAPRGRATLRQRHVQPEQRQHGPHDVSA